jgi:hypothetical protein
LSIGKLTSATTNGRWSLAPNALKDRKAITLSITAFQKTFPALIDTGSSLNLIDSSLVSRLQLRPVQGNLVRFTLADNSHVESNLKVSFPVQIQGSDFILSAAVLSRLPYSCIIGMEFLTVSNATIFPAARKISFPAKFIENPSSSPVAQSVQSAHFVNNPSSSSATQPTQTSAVFSSETPSLLTPVNSASSVEIQSPLENNSAIPSVNISPSTPMLISENNAPQFSENTESPCDSPPFILKIENPALLPSQETVCPLVPSPLSHPKTKIDPTYCDVPSEPQLTQIRPDHVSTPENEPQTKIQATPSQKSKSSPAGRKKVKPKASAKTSETPVLRPSLKRTRSFADLPASFLHSAKKSEQTSNYPAPATLAVRPPKPTPRHSFHKPVSLPPLPTPDPNHLKPKPTPRFVHFDPHPPENCCANVTPSRIPRHVSLLPPRPSNLRSRDSLQVPSRYRQ